MEDDNNFDWGPFSGEDCLITNLEYAKPFFSKDIMFMSQNVRSLAANGENLNEIIKQTNTDIICIQECWKSNHILKDYTIMKKERDKKRGGGVAIIAKSILNLEEVNSYIGKNIEYIIAENSKYQIISIYRPPNGKIQEFSEELNNLLSQNKTNKIIVLGGDFNINLSVESWQSALTFDTLFLSNLICMTKSPTRITSKSKNLIDAIFTNYKYNIKTGVMLTEVSDHLAPFIILEKKKKIATAKTIIYQDTSDKNLKQADTLLHGADWNQLNDSNVEDGFAILEENIKESIDITCQIKKIVANKSNISFNPWLTAGLRKSRSTKLSLYDNYIKTRNKENEIIYRRFNSLYNKILKASKRLYWDVFFKKNYNNSRLIWKQTKEIIGKVKQSQTIPETFKDGTKIIKGEKNIANGFNRHFTGVGESLAKSFGPHNTNYRKYLKKNHNHTFSFQEVSEETVRNFIKGLESKRSSSFDKLSNHMLKKLQNSLVKPLTILINKSLKEGSIPENLKTAKIVPLHKNGPKYLFTNYRPISLLSVLSKIFEKVVYQQLYEYFNEHFLSKFQYGFRRQHETQHCILNFLNNIQKSKYKYHVGIFIDLRKAFDTVDHKILLDKLKYYGLDEQAIAWFRNYLSQRKQATQIGDEVSDFLEIICGVPQGSILGPLLFIIFINDFPDAVKLLVSLFADDTNMQLSGDNIKLLEKTINSELIKASAWFSANRLSLHPGKTVFMVFNNKQGLSLDLYLNNTKIEQVGTQFQTKTVKFLGLLIDDKLKWNYHIDKVINKIRTINYHLNQIKRILPTKLKILLYNALVKPHLEYCLPIYGHSPHLIKLYKIQKKAIRLTFNEKYNSHAEPLFKKANTLALPDLYKLNCQVLLRKQTENVLPISIQEIFTYKATHRRQVSIFERMKNDNKLNASLPFTHMIKIWNENKSNKNIETTIKKYKLIRKTEFISNYNTTCSLKKCYPCKRP